MTIETAVKSHLELKRIPMIIASKRPAILDAMGFNPFPSVPPWPQRMYPNNDIISIGPWIGVVLAGNLYWKIIRVKWTHMATILPTQISAIYSFNLSVTDKMPDTTLTIIIKAATIELIYNISLLRFT
jgi:hypothetical protein